LTSLTYEFSLKGCSFVVLSYKIKYSVSEKKQVYIVGGGAAGFFAAITCAEANPKVVVI